MKLSVFEGIVETLEWRHNEQRKRRLEVEKTRAFN
jgi:hypothetical protein